jgi:tripartite-type tricarboxylate transporter receptor subunit TctC
MAPSITLFRRGAKEPQRESPRGLRPGPEKDAMTLPRRQLLHLAAGAAILPALSWAGWAQAYPARPVRFIVGAAAGSSPDIFARLLGDWLSERLGWPFVIDNRPGAGGNMAFEVAARSPPDGYTLLLAPTSAAINATLYEKVSYNFIRDIAPVAAIARGPQVMLVNPSVPARTVPEFIAYAKANPGKLSMASAGIGTPGHLAGELFKQMAGVDLVHVPYRSGAPAQTDLIGGHVQLMFLSPVGLLEFVQAGKLRALAVTTATRLDALPHIPTVGDYLPSYEASAWWGIGAPRSTPAEIIDKLNTKINAGLADPKIQGRLADLGATGLTLSPSEFGRLIADETEKWGKVIRAANIKPE